jgi:hypothetical protein
MSFHDRKILIKFLPTLVNTRLKKEPVNDCSYIQVDSRKLGKFSNNLETNDYILFDQFLSNPFVFRLC